MLHIFMEYNIVLGNKFEIYYKYIFQNQIRNFYIIINQSNILYLKFMVLFSL